MKEVQAELTKQEYKDLGLWTGTSSKINSQNLLYAPIAFLVLISDFINKDLLIQRLEIPIYTCRHDENEPLKIIGIQ